MIKINEVYYELDLIEIILELRSQLLANRFRFIWKNKRTSRRYNG